MRKLLSYYEKLEVAFKRSQMTEEEERLELEEQDAEVLRLEHAGDGADDDPLMNAQGSMVSDANKTEGSLHNRTYSVAVSTHLDRSSLAKYLMQSKEVLEQAAASQDFGTTVTTRALASLPQSHSTEEVEGMANSVEDTQQEAAGGAYGRASVAASHRECSSSRNFVRVLGAGFGSCQPADTDTGVSPKHAPNDDSCTKDEVDAAQAHSGAKEIEGAGDSCSTVPKEGPDDADAIEHWMGAADLNLKCSGLDSSPSTGLVPEIRVLEKRIKGGSIMRSSSRECDDAEGQTEGRGSSNHVLQFSSRKSCLSQNDRKDSFFDRTLSVALAAEDDEDDVDRGDASPRDDEEANSVKLTRVELSSSDEKALLDCLWNVRPLVSRWSASIVVLLVVAALCCATYMRPAERLNMLIDMAPLLNQAGRRKYMFRMCVFLARELVINEPTARLSKNEAAVALNQCIADFVRIDKALRLGHDLRIRRGTDGLGIRRIDTIMYADGCPWRSSDATSVSDNLALGTPGNMSSKCATHAAAYGLHHLTLAIVEALLTVLSRYAPLVPASDDVLVNPRLPLVRDTFDNVSTSEAKADASSTMVTMNLDAEMRFLLSNHDGDAYMGYDYIIDIFEDRIVRLASEKPVTNIFFAFYLVSLLVGYWYIVFLGSIAHALDEADKTIRCVNVGGLNSEVALQNVSVGICACTEVGNQSMHTRTHTHTHTCSFSLNSEQLALRV